MIKKFSVFSFGLISVCLLSGASLVNQAAPEFALPDTHGKTHKLSDYRGKYVVLEWYNPDCPFVRKHYTGNMQALQREYTAKGVVWLSINSSAPGQEGNYPAQKLNEIAAKDGANRTALLLDPNGSVGHSYGAKTTPDMYVIDPQGKIVYEGAIDSKASTDVSDLKVAQNYVKTTLDSVLASKAPPVTSTRPYGCSVKYGQ